MYFREQTCMLFKNRFFETHRKYFQHCFMFFCERYLIKPFYKKRNKNNIEIEFHDVDETKFCETLIINRTIVSIVSKNYFRVCKKNNRHNHVDNYCDNFEKKLHDVLKRFSRDNCPKYFYYMMTDCFNKNHDVILD